MTSRSMTLIQELTLRGLVQDIMPGTEELLEKEKIAAYIGVDPTASSLHVGNLASLMLLVFLQRDGHQPIALVGGATGMVGDPSGKKEERTLLDEETLLKNQQGIREQMAALLDFERTENPAKLENNYEWFKDMGALEFLRNIGKHLTINYMLAKDSVKSRIESGLSFTEFSYQLIQGYDFCHLYNNHGVKLQMGGSDQWGNITAGTELIRRMCGGEAYAFTCPLMTKADGSKFGKSEGGNIWLDESMTSPYRFYQFWLNSSDEDAEVMIKRFTLLELSEIDTLIQEHAEAPHKRLLQSKLAEEVTVMIHGREKYEAAVVASNILFQGSRSDLAKLDRQQLLELLDGVPTHEISKNDLQTEVSAVEFLSSLTGILSSKSEATRSLKENSISINMEKISLDTMLSQEDLLNEQFVLVQKGKRNRFLVVVS
ncbi:MAG: tyrosine--tRNA ligase [Granulosicoccus sp.]|nr:tyrosine--tRNA ligase [Granulosicoccus sp.]